jgi:hypothetical protein
LLAVKGIQLYNPFQVDGNGNRAPFPNNQIPVSLMDPVAKALFSSNLYPQPVNGNLTNNYFYASNSHIYADQGDVKLGLQLVAKGPAFCSLHTEFSGQSVVEFVPTSWQWI